MEGDAVELVSIGAEIAKLGELLKAARATRDQKTKEVAELEAKLRPLCVKHAEIIASLSGVTVAPPPPPPTQTVVTNDPTTRSGNLLSGGLSSAAKNRIMDFLRKQDGDEPVSATEVANALSIDPALVREVMRELRR